MPSGAPTVRYAPGDDEPLSSAIIAALSEAKGRDVSEDGCVLYDAIDPGALDEIFRQDGDDEEIKVEFVTHDAIVVLWGNGRISIEVQNLEADSNAG